MNIASERKRLGLRQADLAEKLGVSKSTVERWEQNVTPPFGDKLVEMHDLFGCTVDYLLGITDERTSTRA